MTIRDVYNLTLSHEKDPVETIKALFAAYGVRVQYDATETTLWLATHFQEV